MFNRSSKEAQHHTAQNSPGIQFLKLLLYFIFDVWCSLIKFIADP